MQSDLNADATHSILEWINKNWHNLGQYCCQYIAYNAKGIIANGKELDIVLKKAKESGEVYAIYFVPRYTGSMIMLPIHLRNVSRHEWRPNYLVHLKHRDIEIPATMLVDSGADFSVIATESGLDLGYALADSEQTLPAHGIGGVVNYVLRSIQMTIDGHSFKAPVAWIQDENCKTEMILGREVVFDKFNIEFKQIKEKIIFYWNKETR